MLIAGACVAGPSERPSSNAFLEGVDAALDGSRAFQAHYDRELRDDPSSFLTVVAAHYLAPGDALGLVRVSGEWMQAEPEIEPEIEIAAAIEQLTVRRGAESERFDSAGQLVIDDRFTLTISSPQ